MSNVCACTYIGQTFTTTSPKLYIYNVYLYAIITHFGIIYHLPCTNFYHKCHRSIIKGDLKKPYNYTMPISDRLKQFTRCFTIHHYPLFDWA